MSYEKHTWETGETITAEKLNNIEDGIVDSGQDADVFGLLIMETINNDNTTNYIANKSFAEVKNALQSHIPISIVFALDEDGEYGQFAYQYTLAYTPDNGNGEEIIDIVENSFSFSLSQSRGELNMREFTMYSDDSIELSAYDQGKWTISSL